jgi:hypothetical protein
MGLKKIITILLAVLVIVPLTSTAVSAHHPGYGNHGVNNGKGNTGDNGYGNSGQDSGIGNGGTPGQGGPNGPNGP